MAKQEGSRGLTPAELAWKRSGSPGFVFCTACDQPAGPKHTHNHKLTMAEFEQAVQDQKKVQ